MHLANKKNNRHLILNNINKRFSSAGAECSKEDLITTYDFLLLALSPIAPHISEQLYKEILGKTLQDASWPGKEFFEKNETEVKYLIQVNGRVRANIMLEPSLSEGEVKQKAKEHAAMHATCTYTHVQN